MDVRLSEVLAALSHALDITEGQPRGHAERTCLISMRVARQIGLDDTTSATPLPRRAAQGRGLLVQRRQGRRTSTGPTTPTPSATARSPTTSGPPSRSAPLPLHRARPRADRQGQAPQAAGRARLHRLARADRAALRARREVARHIGLSTVAEAAIRELDEHWDGRGYPYSLEGEQISLCGRILCLAQTAEVYWQDGGGAAARGRGRPGAPRHLVRPGARRRARRLRGRPRLLGHARRAARRGAGARRPPAARRRRRPGPHRPRLRRDRRRQDALHRPPLRGRRGDRRRARRRARLRRAPAAPPHARRPAARHRQARRLQPDPRQARQARRRRVGRDAPPPAVDAGDPGADPGLRRPRRRRGQPPREARRHRLRARPGRARPDAGGADPRRRRHRRGADRRPPLPRAAADRPRCWTSCRATSPTRSTPTSSRTCRRSWRRAPPRTHQTPASPSPPDLPRSRDARTAEARRSSGQCRCGCPTSSRPCRTPSTSPAASRGATRNAPA